MTASTFKLVLLVCVVAIGWKVTQPVPEPVPVSANHMEYNILNRIQAPHESLRLLKAWERAEGSDLSCFNPLNTTYPGSGHVINSHGVMCYANAETGLEATINTITNPEYADIVRALQTVDDEAFVRAVGSSRWGTNRALLKQVLDEHVVSSPIDASNDGSCGTNVLVALSTGIKDFTVPAGGHWSFNRMMGNPEQLQYVMCVGVPGGNWCNVAARISQIIRGLGLQPDFSSHGNAVGSLDDTGGFDNQVAIWNIDGQAGGQDLQFTNTSNMTVHIWSIQTNESVTFYGELK